MSQCVFFITLIVEEEGSAEGRIIGAYFRGSTYHVLLCSSLTSHSRVTELGHVLAFSLNGNIEIAKRGPRWDLTASSL